MNAVITMSNESAQIFAAAAVIDQDNEQLVAAVIPYATGNNHAELVQAIKASLTTNANRYVTIRQDTISYMVKSARARFATVSIPMAKLHAEGAVVAWLHALAGNPQDHISDYFYLVFSARGYHERAFVDRLNLALPWPVQPEWGDVIYNAGVSAGLIEPLALLGNTCFYTSAVRISKDSDKWRTVIGDALMTNQIHV